MKTKYLLIIYIFITVIVDSCTTLNPPINTSINPNDVVYWKEDRNLNWDDFQGTPIKGSNLSSQILIQIPSYFQNTGIFYSSWKVECYFDKKRSWVDRTLVRNQSLLYNQALFNIYEIHARKLRKKLSETDFGISDPLSKFQSIVQVNNDELMDEIKNYQTATVMGDNEKAVKAWNVVIAENLTKLKEFKSQ